MGATTAGAAGPAPPPSTGRCPARKLTDNCNINCDDASPQCTGDASGNSFSSSSNSNNGVTTYETSWTVLDGAEGATCRLNCKNADNLDVTTTCSNGQWSMPEKLEAKCGAASPSPASPPAPAPAPSPSPAAPSPSTGRCPA